MGPMEIKDDIFNVMTNSRELTNYCQESIKSFKSKKISDSLNNFHSNTAVEFITKSLTDSNRLFFDLNEVDFNDAVGMINKPIYKKVICYIENHLAVI